jgi:hypothetical protein
MRLDSIKFGEIGQLFAKTDRNSIFLRDLVFGLNISFDRKRQLFCVHLDPGWTPDLGSWAPSKNTWRSIGLRVTSGLSKDEFLSRFEPLIFVRGGL